MKKRILVSLLVMILTFVPVISVYADTNVVSSDATVQTAYEKYNAIVGAMAANSYDLLESEYEELISIISDFTDEQEEEWNCVVNEVIGLNTALSNLYNASHVVYTIGLMQMYQKSPNVRTAYKFVQAYEDCLSLEIAINNMHSGVEAVYTTAKSTDMPSEDVVALYNAYVEVVEALESGNPENLEDAIKEFQAVVDIYNEIDAVEFEELACLLEIKSEDEELTDGEYIAQIIFADWMNINILDTLNKQYSQYVNDPDAENAGGLIMAYEMCFPENEENEIISADLVYSFFPDIDDVYADAKVLLEKSDNLDPDDYDDSSSNDDSDSNLDSDKNESTDKDAVSFPSTGDNFNKQVPLIVILILSVGAGLIAKRKAY